MKLAQFGACFPNVVCHGLLGEVSFDYATQHY